MLLSRRHPSGNGAVAAAAVTTLLAMGVGGDVRADLIGSNLDGINYFDTAQVWADAIRNFSPPGLPTNSAEPNPNLTYDANHNPTQDWGSLAFLVNYPNGVYKFSYSYANGTLGNANVIVNFDDFVKMTNVQTNGATFTADVTLQHPNNDPGAGSLQMVVLNNDPNNPVSNIHLLQPGYSTTNPPVFSNAFIHRTQLFSSLRFMNWSDTNNSTVTSWSQRPVGNQSNIEGANSGVSLENQIALANATGHSAWINVPFLADDNYVHQMARLFRDNLNPNAKIQVELSNEVWNSTFQQFFQARDAANANPDLASIPDDFTKAAKAYALRAKQVSDIFHQEFGAQSNRLQIVFGGQNTQTYWAQQGLDYLNQKFGDPNKTAAQNVSQWFNALTVAPYFGDNSSEVQANSQNLNTLFSYLNSQVAPGGYLDVAIKDAKAQANSYGLQLFAYEGGDSLPKASNNLSDAMLRAAQADPRMYQVLSQLYNTWNADGGGLFMAFSHIGGDKGGGLWGLLNSEAQSGSQKWDATISRLVPAGDATLDGVVDYKDLLVLAKNFGMKTGFWENGDFNHDGVVDAQDLVILAGDYGQGTPFAGYVPQLGSSFASDWAAAQAAAIPEPSAAALAAGIAGCIILRRRRAVGHS